jgi:hypothetical protein
VCKHLLAVDLKAFAELNVGPVDDFLQVLLRSINGNFRRS